MGCARFLRGIMAERVYLWEHGCVPYYDPSFGSFEPYIELYLLDGKDPRPCVVVIPGGGYSGVAFGHEGEKICEMLNKNGFSAVWLYYRVHPYAYPAPQEDAKRAVRTVRYHAKEWGVDLAKIGVIGFSAGAHLAMCTALEYDGGLQNGDAIDMVSSRPDNAALSYGVLSLDPSITHMGTRVNFLGDADVSLAEKYSGENMMRDDAPPFFLWHTSSDEAVPPECSLRFASSLIKAGQQCTMHIFPEGNHGLGLAENTPLANQWGRLYVEWLDYVNGLQ